MLARKALDRGMLHRLLPLLRPIRGAILTVIALEVVLVFTVFLRPLFVRELLDHGLVPQGDHWLLDERLVALLGLGLAASWLGRFLLAGLSQFIAGSAAIRVLNDLRVRVFAHVQALSVGYFDRTKAGRIISRADRDVDSLEPLLIQGPPELLGALLRCAVAGVLLWLISPLFFLALVGTVPLLFAATWAFKRISQRNWARVAENRSRFTAHLVESVSGARMIQQCVQEAPNRARYPAPAAGLQPGADPRQPALRLVRPLHRTARSRRHGRPAAGGRPRPGRRHGERRPGGGKPILRDDVPRPAAGAVGPLRALRHRLRLGAAHLPAARHGAGDHRPPRAADPARRPWRGALRGRALRLRPQGRAPGDPRPGPAHPGRRGTGHRRPLGPRQEHPGATAYALLRRAGRCRAHRRRGRARRRPAPAAPPRRRGAAGQRAVQRQHPRQPAPGRPRRQRRRTDRRRPRAGRRRGARTPAAPVPQRSRPTRCPPQPRPAPAGVPGPRLPRRPGGAGPRRSHLGGGRAHRAAHPARPAPPLRRPHGDHHRPPPGHHPRRRPHRRDPQRPARRTRPPCAADRAQRRLRRPLPDLPAQRRDRRLHRHHPGKGRRAGVTHASLLELRNDGFRGALPILRLNTRPVDTVLIPSEQGPVLRQMAGPISRRHRRCSATCASLRRRSACQSCPSPLTVRPWL
ncbi:hypothetical protein Lal_00007138 [Lupinus albus]|nr:hypothetical protein Lal_00007138 [Lupinus albus]